MISRMRFLLVESNKFHARLMVEALSKAFDGLHICEVTTAAAALEELKHTRFDLALLDLRTLKNDTESLIEQLHASGYGVPAVVMVSEVDTHLAVEAVNRGANAVLLKEADYQSCAAKLVRTVLDRTRIVADTGDAAQCPCGPVDMVKVTVGTLAHEINNPLMTILGNAELVLSGPSQYDRDTMDKMTAIYHSASRIADTLENVARMNDPVLKRTVSGPLLDLTHTTTSSQS